MNKKFFVLLNDALIRYKTLIIILVITNIAMSIICYPRIEQGYFSMYNVRVFVMSTVGLLSVIVFTNIFLAEKTLKFELITKSNYSNNRMLNLQKIMYCMLSSIIIICINLTMEFYYMGSEYLFTSIDELASTFLLLYTFLTLVISSCYLVYIVTRNRAIIVGINLVLYFIAPYFIGMDGEMVEYVYFLYVGSYSINTYLITIIICVLVILIINQFENLISKFVRT